MLDAEMGNCCALSCNSLIFAQIWGVGLGIFLCPSDLHNSVADLQEGLPAS